MVEWFVCLGGIVDIKVIYVLIVWLKLMIGVKWSVVNFLVECCKVNIVKIDRLVFYVMLLVVGFEYFKLVVFG